MIFRQYSTETCFSNYKQTYSFQKFIRTDTSRYYRASIFSYSDIGFWDHYSIKTLKSMNDHHLQSFYLELIKD